MNRDTDTPTVFVHLHDARTNDDDDTYVAIDQIVAVVPKYDGAGDLEATLVHLKGIAEPVIVGETPIAVMDAMRKTGQ
jgi:hypothetical protein